MHEMETDLCIAINMGRSGEDPAQIEEYVEKINYSMDECKDLMKKYEAIKKTSDEDKQYLIVKTAMNQYNEIVSNELLAQINDDTKLQNLRRTNVEEAYRMADNFVLVAVLHKHEVQTMVHEFIFLFSENYLREQAQCFDNHFVAIDVQFTLGLAMRKRREPQANHPNNAKDMVGMLMGDKNVVDFMPGNTCFIQAVKQEAAAPAINQKVLTFVF